jgi:hypothetical protein
VAVVGREEVDGDALGVWGPDAELATLLAKICGAEGVLSTEY